MSLSTAVMALYAAGKLTAADEALVALAAHLAHNLDEFAAGRLKIDFDKTAHQYRMVLCDLRGGDDAGDVDEDADGLVTRFRLAALGDSSAA